MDLITSYWSQIALLITLTVGAMHLYFNYRIRKAELYNSSKVNLQFELVQKFVGAYTNLSLELSTLNQHLFHGSYEDKVITPVLKSYNDAFTNFFTYSQLVKLIYSKKAESKIDALNDILKEAQSSISLYLYFRKTRDTCDHNQFIKASENFATTVSILIPKKIPNIVKEILQEISEDLKLQK